MDINSLGFKGVFSHYNITPSEVEAGGPHSVLEFGAMEP